MPYSPKRMSELSGVSLSYIHQIMSGRRGPTLDVALKIYRTTGAAFGDLAGMTPYQLTVVEGAFK